ncbi:MAG: amylo-alpha-1,6-glucosidase [Nostocaceae cyanobacterium]|nr:amylo-alpha-1,6-glucosidase [Nostocaceae cyanobacterium]
MANLDTREWLLTNGLGSFASGTVCDIRTRTYHGWLFAATNPPSERTLLLSHLEASLELPGRLVELGTNVWGSSQIEPRGYELLGYFDVNPTPTWVWGEQNWQLSRQLVMPYGLLKGGEANKSPVLDSQPQFCHRILIQYHYQGRDIATLKLRPLIGDRNFHHQQKQSPQLQFSQILGYNQVCLQGIFAEGHGTPWYLRWSQGDYHQDGFWYRDYGLLEESRRGLGDREDLYSPGYISINLQPGDIITLEARVGFPDSLQPPLNKDTFVTAIAAEEKRLSQIFAWEERETREKGETRERGRGGDYQLPITNYPLPITNYQLSIKQQLLRASDQFIVYRASIAGPTVIAGYHWFGDWGRDTLIALPGLALVPQRFELAKGLLETFGRYCRQGLIPNVFPDVGSEPTYNSIDAALWWIETLGLYIEATNDWEFLAKQYPVAQQIYKGFIGGTRYNIYVDVTDGLVGWDAPGSALTWMDAIVDGHPVTPRRGKPVEINALWYSALCWMSQWAECLRKGGYGDGVRLAKQGQRYLQHAQQIKTSLQKFWNRQLGYLYDTIQPDDHRNSQIRPNAVLALSLHHCGFSQQQGQQILALAKSNLLTPYGLRSLDPKDPEYIGKYQGNQRRRDRAYHQGTVWSWLIGPFIRAWQRFYPQEPLPFNSQPLLEHFLSDACLGSISEIFDGDEPHYPRGAIAQAWSVAEVLRHFETYQINL